MSSPDQELLAIFRDEVAESLDELSQLVDVLRNGPDTAVEECITAAFRVAHNIKGASHFAGINSVKELAHNMEEGLSPYRKTAQRPPADLLDQLMASIVLIERAVEGDDVAQNVASLIGEINALEKSVAQQDAPQPDEQVIAPTCPETSVGPKGPEQNDDDAGPSKPGGPATTTVRVDVNRLDRVMAYVADFLGVQAKMGQRVETLAELRENLRRALATHDHDLLTQVARHMDAINREDRAEQIALTHLVDGFSSAMKRVRMLPLAGHAAQWRRIVRECANALNKRVELSVNVGDVEIDKHILDELRDPVMHLLRNAVDHGIEAESERTLAGKPETGTIAVRATMRGTVVVLEVSDDGRGVDRERIGAKAIEKGWLTSDHLQHIAAEELLQNVFKAGFSTADNVTQVSGRGVGLDVVRGRVEALGGSAEVAPNARLGGATFVLSVPATLVSTKGLLVRAGGADYALPIDHVMRTLRVKADRIEHLDGGGAIRVDDADPIRIRSLASLMGQRRTPQPEWLNVVVVAHTCVRLGLLVEDVVGEEEFVTQGLPWNLPPLPGVNGAAVLAGGNMAIVVDLPHIMGEATRKGPGTLDDLGRETPVKGIPRILVVDDSLTSRTLERNILQAAGFQVEVAVDGEEAWELLLANTFDLVVSDVDMPELDGLSLTRRIRGHAKLAATPVILVTSLDRPDDLAEGAAAGADEYIVKGHFDQRKLLEAVSRLT